MHFIDTNVLLYSVSHDPAEAEKRDTAIAVLDKDGGALSVQVLQEFYAQATRATRADRLPHHIAVGLISTWTRFRVQDVTLGILNGAFDIKERFKLSYWDCAIIAAARALGCRELLSEDMHHGLEIDGVIIRNPFLK